MDKFVDSLFKDGLVGALFMVVLSIAFYYFKKHSNSIEKKIDGLDSKVSKMGSSFPLFEKAIDEKIDILKSSMADHAEDLYKVKTEIKNEFFRLRENTLSIKEELSIDIIEAKIEVKYLKNVHNEAKESVGKVIWLKEEVEKNIKSLKRDNVDARSISVEAKDESQKNRKALEQAKKIYKNHNERIAQNKSEIKKIATELESSKKKKSKNGI